MAWLDGWQYRKSVTLSWASGAVTNYQMLLLLGESAGAVGEDVDCGGLCQADFDDIRFTKADGVTLLDYWIESVSGATPNQLSTIWIEFDSIGTSETTFYMYYGNAVASAQYATPLLAGEATFPFFDDFSGASIDSAKWNIVNAPAVSTGEAVIDNSDQIYGQTAFGYGHAVRSKSKADEQDISFVEWWVDSNNRHSFDNSDYGYPDDFDRAALSSVKAGSSQVNYLDNIEDFRNTYAIYEIQRFSDTSTYFKKYGAVNTYSFQLTSSTYTYTGSMYPSLRTWDSSQESILNSDWILVRRLLSIEPAWGAWGSAERLALTDSSLNLAAYYQKLSDLETYLRAHDGIELHDLNAELSAWGLAVEDLASWMAAYYESMDSLGANLSTVATGYKNLPGYYDAKGQRIEAFMTYLAAAKNKFKDLAMLLDAVNGSILNDIGVSLAVTNGIVAKDLGMFLQALSAVPAFRSVTAHRVSSVIHEII